MEALTSAPELLIALLRPESVLLVLSMFTVVLLPPTWIVNVPVPMAAETLENEFDSIVCALASESTTTVLKPDSAVESALALNTELSLLVADRLVKSLARERSSAADLRSASWLTRDV